MLYFSKRDVFPSISVARNYKRERWNIRNKREGEKGGKYMLILNCGETKYKAMMVDEFYQMGMSVMFIKDIEMLEMGERKKVLEVKKSKMKAGDIFTIKPQKEKDFITLLKDGKEYLCLRRELEEYSIIYKTGGLEVSMEKGDGIFQRDMVMRFSPDDYTMYGEEIKSAVESELLPYIAYSMACLEDGMEEEEKKEEGHKIQEALKELSENLGNGLGMGAVTKTAEKIHAIADAAGSRASKPRVSECMDCENTKVSDRKIILMPTFYSP